MARTEDDILSKAPIKVKLGDSEYEIKILTINAQRAWRTQLSEELAEIIANFNPEVSKNTMALGLTGALIDFPEKLAELVFTYATKYEVSDVVCVDGHFSFIEQPVGETYLPKEKILTEATEEQIAKAFSEVMTVAFPFLSQLQLVTQLVRSKQSQRQ